MRMKALVRLDPLRTEIKETIGETHGNSLKN